MKRRKNPLSGALLLLGVSASIIALSVFVLKPYFQKEVKEKEKSDLLWKDARREKILEVGLTNDKGSFLLKKSGESKEWIIESDKTFDADNSAIDSLISGLLGTKKEDDLVIDLKSAGLDSPKITIKFVYVTDKDQKIEKTLLLGEDSPVDYKTYAKWADQNNVFMIAKSLKFSADKKIDDFRNKKIIKYQLADLKAVNVSSKTLPSLNYSINWGEGGKWKINLGKRIYAADQGSLSDWLSKLSNTKVVNFAADNKSNLAKYGLHRPFGKIEFQSLKGENQSWTIGLAIIDSEKNNHVFIMNNNSDFIYEMPISFWEELKKDPQDLRIKNIFNVDRNQVASIHYKNDKFELTLLKEGAQWKADFNPLSKLKNATKVDGIALKEAPERILNTFSKLKAKSFIDKSPQSSSLELKTSKVEFFDAQSKLLGELSLGKEVTPGAYAAWNKDMEDPCLITSDLKQIFPDDPTKLIEKKSLDKAPPPEPSSKAQGKHKIMKLEKTVASVKELKKLPASIVEPGAKYTAVMSFKNGKRLKISLAADKAPYTVSNFIHLARNGFFDGVVFHRVIPDFVAQGGDPTGTGRGGPGWMFNNEDNDLKHLTGSLSMAHAGRDTNGSQFFVVLKPQPHLDGLHTVFGQVVEGLDQIELIKQGDAMSGVEIYEEK